jgi:2-polyprenyl-3-methyl-5-hydroxy-6-metoxy-1,4-benzoquinol methylase
MWYSQPEHWYRKLVDRSLKFLEGESGVILDVGSGDGLVDRLLIDKGFKVIGIELEKDGCAIAKERVPEMTILNTKSEKAEVPEVDYLFSLNVIEHVKKPEIFTKLMGKVRKFAIVITDNKIYNSKYKGTGTFNNKEFSMEELKFLFKEFRVEELDLGNEEFIGLKILKNTV